jgi:uncharacterized protein YceH (UPF0502 family)
MAMDLNEAEVRVLGCLIEKQLTTPEYYPLTLLAVTAACNQKNNRDPLVAFDEKTVVRTLDSLRNRKLLCMLSLAGSRVPKYAHQVETLGPLTPPQIALLCELMLRGPQTVGELRTHAERMQPFASLEEVETVLNELLAREAGALVVRLPRQSGRKECRYAHLLAGEVKVQEPVLPALAEPVRLEVQVEEDRLGRLEQELRQVRDELAALQAQFAGFRKQFE